MTSTTTINFHFFTFILVLVLVIPTTSLNTDGVLLLSFKYSVLSDPLSVLDSWNYGDVTPCSWNGVTCTEIGLTGTPDMFRVTSLVLPGSQLLGSIPPDLGYIEHLRHLDLSHNFLNGSLPDSFFNLTELQVISLSGNEISGHLPESIGGMKSLQLLNLSDNAFDGQIPKNLSNLQNLTVVSLRSNYFSGHVLSGFDSVQVLDLSSNLLNGSLPLDFGGDDLRYLNLSYNKLSGSISPLFAKKIPNNATIDLSFNNLTGAIPETLTLTNQKTESYRGNLDLCGKPLKNTCSIPSTLSTPPNISTTSPAIAVIPKPIDTTSNQPTNSSTTQTQNTSKPRSGLKAGTLVAIAVADLAGISILALVILYVYRVKKRKTDQNQTNPLKPNPNPKPPRPPPITTTTTLKSETNPRKPSSCSCLKASKSEERTSSEEATTSDSDHDQENNDVVPTKGGKLVMVDGETELEMETLLKASAYILGASSGGSIVYKAVLSDGTAFAVRRIGDTGGSGGGGVVRFKEFENQVRAIAKLRHNNVVRVRGFCWGEEEKLVIYDYVSNGSLATSGQRRPGASPYHLPLEVRFKIARGIARGLVFLHDKKHVHGNIKPSNILLTSDMEPLVSDLGLDRLVLGSNNYKSNNSGRHFGSQRSTSTSLDHPVTASPYAGPSSATANSSPYQAPESLKNLKPNPKWDIYSFGVILLELLTGRAFSDRELSQWNASVVMEDKNRVLRLADVAIRGDLETKEDAVLASFKLGFSCASFLPQKRPSMKEALQVLEKIPCTYSN